MTRKEAIKGLKDILEEATRTDNSVCYITSADADILKVAINSLEIDERYELEYEQIEPCEDAISRQAVLDIVSNPLNIRLDAIIKELPPVTPQPKTGRWINRHIIANKTIDMIVCSECGEEFSYDAETGVSEYKYCPHCGAKMEEEE